ncbi:hypothetical protein C9374_007117 [Naegleria lovaniensis]|uniref:VLRF1 domain-containing protein n=1 Tax=Naegleria lovaniensis TaxID=51637 RepID=A0AA88H4E1_NAELO|nr:uncharacterized protein C9374_007117 [Naegleria lovaniensis]KAG2393586.1 hypothetical protein C9374_007117 [Naegleria lovaniensis]
MFQNLSSFVDSVNKKHERNQLNRLRERTKYLNDDDDHTMDDLISSPTQRKLLDYEIRKEGAFILSTHRRVVNHILLFLMDFSIYNDAETNHDSKKKKKKKKPQHTISDDLMNLLLVNKLWSELVHAHYWTNETLRSSFSSSGSTNDSSFFGKTPLVSTPNHVLKIPFQFHSISGINQTKIVLKLDTQTPIYISFYKIYFEIFEYLQELNNGIQRRKDIESNTDYRIDPVITEFIEHSTERMKMILLFNHHHEYQFFLKALKDHFSQYGFCTLFCHGGTFSCCVFEKSRKLEQMVPSSLHKTFHKYVTRKKQGKRQVSKDQNKRCKSVGSEIRRIQEEHFKLKSRKYLVSWSDVLGQRETVIFLNAPGPYNEYTLFNRKKEAGSRMVSITSSNELDDETKAVQSKENKYADYVDKKYVCPFTKSQCFTMPGVKGINTSSPNHTSNLEANDELLSIYFHDEEGLQSLQTNSTLSPQQGGTSNLESDEGMDEVLSNDDDEDYEDI